MTPGRGGGSTDPSEALERKLAAGQLDPVYVLYGDEPAEMRRVLQAIRDAVIPPKDATAVSMAAFNHERFDGVDVRAVSRVLEACAQVPMMSKVRLVELVNPDDLGGKGGGDDGPTSTKDAANTALAAYIAEPSPTTVLVIHGAGIDGRSKLVNAARKQGWAHKFAGLERDEDAVAWIQRAARRMGRTLAPEAANVLVSSVGTGQTELLQGLERAALYAGDRGGTERPIERSDVEAVVATTREASVFALTDAVGQGDHRAALALLAAMYSAKEKDSGTAHRVLALLARHMRLLFSAFSLGPREFGGAAGLPPFIARKYLAQARTINEGRLRAAYAGLVRLDHDLKGGSWVAYASPYLALQRWILDVCGALPGVSPRR